MSFVRFLCRSLLAGYFIADGARAAFDPEPQVVDAEPLAEKATQVAYRYLPAEVVQFVPSTTEGLVRLHGTTQAVGALMMATGLFRRLGALIVAVSYLPKIIMSGRKSWTSTTFLRELALLGGVLIEVGDTQGKPKNSWISAYHMHEAAQVRAIAKEQSKHLSRRTKALGEVFETSKRP
ncbi:MAG: DoxX family membrane protein [Propionibacteriaceae bacterium]|jgi:uncharacterized membrane protein YphA (DoxX/SURF4 family)|nr:DoxX family membrane protein [Propionibacteriaceae bacterium]